MKLGYWNIRGFAAPIRYLLAYKEVEFEDKLYDFGPPPDFDRSEWLEEKFDLELDFPNLPYLIDGDVKMSQSTAILRYLARKFDLVGSTDGEQLRVELAEQQFNDIRTQWCRLCYNPKFAELRDGYVASIPSILMDVSEFLGNRPFFAGSKLTYVDFVAYEMLARLLVFNKQSFASFGKLKDFIDRIESLPTLKAYLESDECLKWPFNGDMAFWGSRYSEKPL